MNINKFTLRALSVGAFAILFSLPVSATASCGSLIETDGVNSFANPIENCENPFNADTEFTLTPTLLINGTAVDDGDSLEINFNESLSVEVTYENPPFRFNYIIYEREGDDYIFDYSTADISGPGDYTAVIITDVERPILVQRSAWEKIRSFIIPTAHAFFPPSSEIEVIDFTVTEFIEEVEELSELLLKYEPILQFHEDEDYFPMNLDAFVEGSGLWDSTRIDEVLVARVTDPVLETNILNLDYLATSTDTDNWYINFSSDNPGDFDLAEAKGRYDALVAADIAVPTYYAHESKHSYTDDLGTEREFIVLQYWYFYAMNDWGEKGGSNNHEGDWESVFVFLDEETEEPLYAAFSAHHNDGNPDLNAIQYESVRREWSETEKEGDQVISYVAVGAHAMYSFAANHEVPSVNPGVEVFDRTSKDGIVYKNNTWELRKLLTLRDKGWLNEFEGKFGSDPLGDPFGSRSGIEGPLYNKVSGTNRFLEPLIWAGIDAITETTLDEPEDTFVFNQQGVSFVFGELLPAGTNFSSSLFEEFISFGSNVADIDLLPKFWDFKISLPNGSFSVETTLGYDPTILEALGINESRLGIYFYNEVTDEWEVVPSALDLQSKTVSFITNHFSIYSIGELPENGSSSDEQNTEDETASSTATSTDTEIEEPVERSSNAGTRVTRSTPTVLGISTDDEEAARGELMQEIITLLEKLIEILS